MANSVVRHFDTPDEHRAFSHGTLNLISIGPLTFGRETLEPGWHWMKDVQPIAGTDRCEFHHVGYQVSGRWVVEDRDGTQTEIGPGDVFDTPPGHDSWVVGDEVCVTIDFQGIADWAARGTSARILTTLVFTDVVGSTALIDRIGDAAWRRLRAQYLEKAQVLIREHGGTLVDTTGDGVLARFDRPAAAVQAASDMTAAATPLGLEIRAGVHTGEVEQTGAALSGMAVHVGARVMAEAGPGEVLVTATTRELTLDAGLDYDDRGPVALKGVPGARVLYALRA